MLTNRYMETFVIIYKENPKDFYNKNLNAEANTATEALSDFITEHPDAVFQAMYNKRIQLF